MLLFWAIVAGALTLTLAVVFWVASSRRWFWRREFDLLDQIDLESEFDEFTEFQRFILAEFRARRGVPKLTQANDIMVRREVYALLKEHRPLIRGVDLEMHCAKVTAMAFIPSRWDVNISEVLHPDESLFGWFWESIVGSAPVRGRIEALRRPGP